MPITLYPTTFKYKDNNGQYQSVNAIKGDPGEVTQSEFDTVADDVNDLKSAINDAPSEETAQKLLVASESFSFFLDATLGILIDDRETMPTEDTGEDIVFALATENDYLAIIVDGIARLVEGDA